MAVNDTTQAIQLTTESARSNTSLFLRAEGKNAFDAACFHYSTYRALTRFLGMDGDLGADGETPVDFIDAWNDFIRTNDLINPNTGVFDPRHMYGAQNQVRRYARCFALHEHCPILRGITSHGIDDESLPLPPNYDC